MPAPNPTPAVSLVRSDALVTPPGYSHAASVHHARLVYTAGQIGANARGELAGPDFRTQAEQVFINLGLALKAASATFADVIKLTIFVTDLSELAALREIRDRYVNTQRPPASTLVQVAQLFRPEYKIEIEAIAAVHD